MDKDVKSCWMRVLRGLAKNRTQQGGKMLYLNNMMDLTCCAYLAEARD